jgi:hypothetical protein
MENKTNSFIAKKKGDYCIEIEIESEIDLEDAIIKVLGKDRELLAKIKHLKYNMEICLYTGNPMFVEIVNHNGSEVKYVQGSGDKFYEN